MLLFRSSPRDDQCGCSAPAEAIFNALQRDCRCCCFGRMPTLLICFWWLIFDVVVYAQVYAVDKYARQKVIGEADVRVGDVDLNIPIKMWLNLRDLDEVSSWCRYCLVTQT